MNYDVLSNYIQLGLSSYEISQRENTSPTNVRYWLRKFGLKTKHLNKRGGGRFARSMLHSLSRDQLQSLASQSVSIKEILDKLGLTVCAYQYKAFHAAVIDHDIDITSLAGSKPGARFPTEAIKANSPSLDELLIETYRPISNTTIKRRLIKDGLLQPRCAKCNIGDTWMGEPITLQLDRVNGLKTDNRLENLRLLCPNCHSQTPTWGSKRRRSGC